MGNLSKLEESCSIQSFYSGLNFDLGFLQFAVNGECVRYVEGLDNTVKT